MPAVKLTVCEIVNQ